MLGRELRIVHWALMLRWPKEEFIGPGISVFELAVNSLGVVGSPMPKVLQYVNKYPESLVILCKVQKQT